jgi:molybdopterin-guanine dinucleotide biosynthesis protein A|tara:strand:+ start:250 stop:366 length:117 start_codon:yes stop_codon:yes gene_type:complete
MSREKIRIKDLLKKIDVLKMKIDENREISFDSINNKYE